MKGLGMGAENIAKISSLKREIQYRLMLSSINYARKKGSDWK